MKKLLVMSAFLAAASGSAIADEALARSKNCMACHQVGAKVVGPSYKDVAKKYSNADAAKLANSIVNGSKGTWGAVQMPPNSQVSAEEAKALAAWILSLK